MPTLVQRIAVGRNDDERLEGDLCHTWQRGGSDGWDPGGPMGAKAQQITVGRVGVPNRSALDDATHGMRRRQRK
jgi:hypothetical protein